MYSPWSSPPNHSPAWKAAPAVKALCAGSLPRSSWASLRQDARPVHPVSHPVEKGQPVLPCHTGAVQGQYSLSLLRCLGRGSGGKM